MDTHSAEVVDGKADSGDLCNICFSDMVNSKVTFCNHQFCESCLDKWLQTQQSSEQGAGICPVCRSTITAFPDPQRQLDGAPADRETALIAAILALIMGLIIGNCAGNVDHVPEDTLDREAIETLALEVEEYLRLRGTEGH